MFMSNCSGTTTVHKRRAIRLPSSWRAACNCRCWPRKEHSTPGRNSARFWMSSPAFATIARSIRAAVCWLATASATSRRRSKCCNCSPICLRLLRTHWSCRRALYLRPGQNDLWQRAQRQIERELALIEHLELAGYFLIVWDIVRYCRMQNILVQGRGSAANSAVCYSLGITAVDPVGMELLFERFLSEERGEWPDIDLDLPSGDQRERVIQYVYDRYGKLGAAMTANVITYRGRSAAREVGKALGFDGETLDRLAGLVSSWEYKDPSDTLERQFRDAGFDLGHPRMRKFFELCVAVQDLPRHLGQHSGGMVIC